jgi:hypothetical protein
MARNESPEKEKTMRMLSIAAAALAAGLFSQGASAACYVVYGPDKIVVYRAPEPPVDLSRPLHETLAEVLPGGTLVFSLEEYGCDVEVHKLPPAPHAGQQKAR